MTPISAPSPLPGQAVIREVGLRDGLQSIARTLPTAQKLQWIRAAYDAGQREKVETAEVRRLVNAVIDAVINAGVEGLPNTLNTTLAVAA